MKVIILVCFLGVVAMALARPNDEQYTNKYDDLNIQEILSNRRLLLPYVKCVLDQGKCAPEGTELKAHIREALENECKKCNEKQRDGTRQVIKHLINHEDALWKELIGKYDPEKKYVEKYEKELKEIKA